MEIEELKQLSNLLTKFICDYGIELQESSVYAETDKISVNDVEEYLQELLKGGKKCCIEYLQKEKIVKR